MILGVVKIAVKLSVFLFMLLGFVSTSYASDCAHDDQGFNCVEYVRTYDGDTFFIDIPNVHSFFGNQISVRVRGIDTGEVTNHSGQRTQCEIEMAHLAKSEAERLFENAGKIEIRNVARGKYFRVVGDVYINGRSLGNHLIRKGLAVPYNGGDRSSTDWCKVQSKLKNELI